MTENTVREAREARGLTYREISEETGIPISTIRSWEEGSIDEHMSRLQKLAKKLKRPLTKLWPVPEVRS